MERQYIFIHKCGHTGLGPNVPVNGESAHQTYAALGEGLDVIRLPLPFRCPFCTGSCCTMNIQEGSGVLAILTSTQGDPFPNSWRVLRVCRAEQVTSPNWALAHEPGAIYRQIAWIPRPCGVADDVGGVEGLGRRDRREVGRVAEVRCSWKQPLRELVRSRLAGMLSELNASSLPGRA
jgi:hypothetical protein